MSMMTSATAECSGISWLAGPSRPVVATKEVMPRNSGTPAATTAPNAIRRMISVPRVEIFCDFAWSARSCGPKAFCSDAWPSSATSSSGWAFWTAAVAASGASASVSSFSRSASVVGLAGIENVTSTERPSCETVFARCAATSGLSMSLTPLMPWRRCTTSLTAAVTCGSSALIEPLPWIRTRSPASAGKPASSAITAPRLESPLPDATSLSWFCPTLPPITQARTTNRIQPRMAVFRCVALQWPARAARFFLGGKVVSPVWGAITTRRKVSAARRPSHAAFRRLYGDLPPAPGGGYRTPSGGLAAPSACGWLRPHGPVRAVPRPRDDDGASGQPRCVRAGLPCMHPHPRRTTRQAVRAPLAIALAAGLLAPAAASAAPAGCPAAGRPYDAGVNCRTVEVDGYPRRFLVYVPNRGTATGTRPVVFMFHGSSGTGDQFLRISGWREQADATGLIAVFPTGLSYRDLDTGRLTTKWNDGHLDQEVDLGERPPDYPGGAPWPADDVGFTDAMLADVRTQLPVDRHRVYASGFSNGANFAARLGVERSTVLAAV